jgi:hypothetical protein
MDHIISGVGSSIESGPVLTPALILYVAGVLLGVLRVDGGPATRLVVALLWPVGVAAGVLTVGSLVLVAMVVFPLVGAAAAATAVLLWWAW